MESVYLHGAEDVQRAGNRIAAAAESISTTASWLIDALERDRVQRAELLEVTVRRIAAEFSVIAFSNLLDYLEPIEIGGKRRFIGKAPDKLTETQARAVARMRVVEINEKGFVFYDHQYELHGKSVALSELAKYMGMYSTLINLTRTDV
jgi:hypothetical protein